MEISYHDHFSTLGHPQRLAVFRLLMRRYPDRVPATELAQALGLKSSTLSTYVSALMKAGLVSQERVGTSLRYAIDMDATRLTVDYLLNDCCRGRPEICAPNARPAPKRDSPMSDRKYNVLFICTGNSARSIFAESILRDLAGDRFVAYSAGTKPRSALNPFTLRVLEHEGHDISGLWAKNISEFQRTDAPDLDFVFTVCDQAANEECSTWQGQPISAHWGLPDPVKVGGSAADKGLAFQQTYGAMRHRMARFTTLPIVALDRISLQRAVDEIGRSNQEGAFA